MTQERLQKVMARIGVASRRVCEEMIAEGRVLLNQKVATLGDKASEDDEITVDGSVLSAKPDAVTYLLNKPTGVVTTASDTHGRKVVTSLVPDEVRIFPVGRLDMDSEGLLLLTNDGALAHRLTHPSFGVEKEYVVQVQGTPSRAALRQLREGVELDDGMTAPAKVALLAPEALRITIHEGKNRQVRRMCDAVGHKVTRLVRTQIGPLKDPNLAPGGYRLLQPKEVLALQRAVQTTPAIKG